MDKNASKQRRHNDNSLQIGGQKLSGEQFTISDPCEENILPGLTLILTRKETCGERGYNQRNYEKGQVLQLPILQEEWSKQDRAYQ